MHLNNFTCSISGQAKQGKMVEYIAQKNKTSNVRNVIRKHTLFITFFPPPTFILVPEHTCAQSSLPHSPSSSMLSDDVILSITTRLGFGWAKKWTSKGTEHTYVMGRYFLLVRLPLKGPQAIHNTYAPFPSPKHIHTYISIHTYMHICFVFILPLPTSSQACLHFCQDQH